jgi:ribosomal protein S18 acetylase RimI-like enzyme
MEIRLVQESDYYVISPLINDWWNGRQMSDMLPKLFFTHFKNTSFIAQEEGEIIGFLIGFLSQSYSNEAYIHFVGIHPEHRGKGIGRQLYNQFFDVIKQHGRSIIRCVTSPVNKVSIAYHTKMGFEIEQGDGVNQDKVLFLKRLT